MKQELRLKWWEASLMWFFIGMVGAVGFKIGGWFMAGAMILAVSFILYWQLSLYIGRGARK